MNYQGIQLTNNSIKNGTSLALMVAYSASTFQLAGKAESQKIGAKNEMQK